MRTTTTTFMTTTVASAASATEKLKDICVLALFVSKSAGGDCN